MNRRRFLAATGLTLAVPTIIPASALGLEKKAAPQTVPDTWHALIAVEPANNKEDIYGEKPQMRITICPLGTLGPFQKPVQ